MRKFNGDAWRDFCIADILLGWLLGAHPIKEGASSAGGVANGAGPGTSAQTNADRQTTDANGDIIRTWDANRRTNQILLASNRWRMDPNGIVTYYSTDSQVGDMILAAILLHETCHFNDQYVLKNNANEPTALQEKCHKIKKEIDAAAREIGALNALKAAAAQGICELAPLSPGQSQQVDGRIKRLNDWIATQRAKAAALQC